MNLMKLILGSVCATLIHSIISYTTCTLTSTNSKVPLMRRRKKTMLKGEKGFE